MRTVTATVALAAAVAVVATGVATAGVATAGATPASTPDRTDCPKAESLIPGMNWTTVRLSPGVRLRSGTTRDAKGRVRLHVLTVNLATAGVSVRPLVDDVGERLPLTRLTEGHRKLVAATNTGYFDFETGAPTGPLITGGQPLAISRRHQRVVGITADGRVETGEVALEPQPVLTASSPNLAAVNDPTPPVGLTFYTARWGPARIPHPAHSVDRILWSSRLEAPGPWVDYTPERQGVLLARGRTAVDWLDDQESGQKLDLHRSVSTNAPKPFVQAYGVGTEVVQKHGVVRHGLTCDSANTPQPARTDVGFSHHGTRLVLVTVEDDPRTTLHGLDNGQMSKVMVQLGVDRAFSFDGSGSTELLARLPGEQNVHRQTYPADGTQRPMPVGLGIAFHPARRGVR